MIKRSLTSIVAAAAMSYQSGSVLGAQSAWFPVQADAIYQTGDSWRAEGVTYRLYGVQACLRGTSFTNIFGLKRDCGEASLTMLAALIRDLQPQCYAAAEQPKAATVFVFCVATRLEGVGKGSRIDLGTALIVLGFAFAALTPDGRPVHAPYLEAQRRAQQSQAGLWAFSDLPDPNAIILETLRRSARAGAMTAPTTDPTTGDKP